MKKQIKNSVKPLIMLICLLSFSFSFAQSVNVNTIEGANDIDNKDDILENGIKPWRTFELNVGSSLSASNSYYQVYLDVNGTTIIADYLVKTGTGVSATYKVIDAKASKLVDLTTLASLSGKCTTNQKTVYALINAGVITAKVKTNRNNLSGLNQIATNEVITLQKGVDFYVTNPKAQYITFKVRAL